MHESDFPSQYELCRIAASLRDVDTTKEPTIALRAALRLWLSAGLELSTAKRRDFYDNAVAYRDESISNEDLLENYVGFCFSVEELSERDAKKAGLIQFGEDETSDAFKWVNDNAPTKKDKFKTFREFKKAWEEILGAYAEGCRKRCSQFHLERFLEGRIQKRREADRARKRKTRSLKRGAESLSK